MRILKCKFQIFSALYRIINSLNCLQQFIFLIYDANKSFYFNLGFLFDYFIICLSFLAINIKQKIFLVNVFSPNINKCLFRRNGVVGVGSYRSNYAWKERAGRTDQYNSDKLDRTKPVNGHSGILDHPQPIISTHRTKKKRRKSRSSDSGSNSSGSGSGSRSSSSSSSRSSSSGSNSSKSRSPSRASVTSKIKSSLGNYLPHTEFDKQCTIIVRNLPHRIEGENSS